MSRPREEECPHGIRRWIYCMECARVGVAVDPLRSCSDCEAYAPVSKMIEKRDGRIICPGCQKKVERVTAERAQVSFFGQQSLI